MRWIWCFILVVFGVLAVMFTSNITGFCLERMRFLSDEENFGSAIEVYLLGDITAAYFSPPGQRKTAKYVLIERPHSIQEFLEANPDCCRYGRVAEGAGVTVWDRILGRASKVVAIKYAHKYPNRDGVILEERRVLQVGISPCGSVLRR